MIKILICDDEGIVRQSLRFIIEKSFGDRCQIEEAKSGRGAVEITQRFRPDIAFMDIQMPGINGIEAMREMQKENANMEFIVLTAYDRFGYAKDAIDLGVLEYLTKPMNRDKVVEVLQRAIREVEERRRKTSYDLEIREKLETVIPIIENGFINSVIIMEEGHHEELGYDNLLNLSGKMGIMMVVEFGEDHREDGGLTNPVGSNVKMQKCYSDFCTTLKSYNQCIIGAIMANKIIVCLPVEKDYGEYNNRVQLIEQARAIVRKLEQQIGLKFQIGIGSVRPLPQLNESYKEALTALRQSIGKVTHIKDIPVGCVYEDEYPIEMEDIIFDALAKAKKEMMLEECRKFMEWIQNEIPEIDNNVRLKAMEFVLRAETMAYRHGGMRYNLESRRGFMEQVLQCKTYQELNLWFEDKMATACHNISEKQKEQNLSVVAQAKHYIEENYTKELSLDDISREMNISPYYFSKLFKDETGVNYIEYVTKLRIDCAKELLRNPENSIKMVCVEVGYSDPNYFSRIFKKWVGQTPSEYRGGSSHEE